MIALWTALAGASLSTCAPVAGAQRLWAVTNRWVIIGEVHGSAETPAAFANLVCLASKSGRPITVAVEFPTDGQAAINAYLASNGNRLARSNLLALPTFTAAMQDGRGSEAFLRLFEQLRLMKQAGKISAVITADVSRAGGPPVSRDAAMAAAWTAASTGGEGLVLALVGNLHAMRKPLRSPTRTVVTAGSLMPIGQTVTVNVTGNGGQVWNCQQDGCGAHSAGPARELAGGFTFSEDPDRRWDATYQLGMATTASPPAILRSKPLNDDERKVR